MEGSEKREHKKNKTVEVSRLQVPSALRKIKANIDSNTAGQISKEELINQAFKFHSQGNILEAAKYYQDFINQGFEDHRVYSNLGIILKNRGNLKEAESYYRKSIAIDPNYSNAHANLGNILKDLGNLKEAELSIRRAIELNPNLAISHSNLGNILRDLGNLKEAELSFRRAITLDHDYAVGHFNLGNILRDLGNLKEAFDCYLKTIEIDPNYPNFYPFITRFLNESNPSLLNQTKLKIILNDLLKRNDIPHKELFNAFKFSYINKIENNQGKLNLEYSKNGLFSSERVFINALKKIIFKDYRLEMLLTSIRKNTCDQIEKNKVELNDYELEFIFALAEQCFLNEYIYSFSKEEELSINKIIQLCINGEINEQNIAIIACYYPLYKILDQLPSLKNFNSSNPSFNELIILQVSEPLKEINLSKSIKKLGIITDDISKQVKSQYEQSPYPRWRYGNIFNEKKFSSIQVINNEIKPNSIGLNFYNKEIKILIAGCGTGNQILQSQKYTNAQIIGIDISLSSLSYAQRKINELGINNVELIQMDILEISLLKEKFDIIECSGVLHHMNDPSRGLRALLDVLKNNGFLKLGLYSELARKNIVQAREYISTNNLQSNDQDIRAFRENIFSDKIKQISNLRNSGDFFTMSECRDLCFHTKEHRFTINRLQKTFKSNGLEFLGFLIQQPIKSLYTKNFPQDTKQINLQNWARFEEKFPNTFGGMYQFWVCKTRI
ncbi:tetratricopeptide repeat protein [Prochlorococcus marinus]|uniref:tetratricopeptide repeat protein n=1 Tax=Prochlorococcus marinus TaxID=1219 RepID=UPI0022B4C2F0|nr:tetratricopeptide repeat protein [Prochlorococcus marinus]